MAKIYTSQDDEALIKDVLRHGFNTPNAEKWTVLRLGLALSLRIQTEPDDALDSALPRGSEYAFEQLTGEHKLSDEHGLLDYTDAFRALLSAYHDEDLFVDEERFRKLLQRHVRRGLREMRTSWRIGHDFAGYLAQELFAGIDSSGKVTTATSGDAREKLVKALTEVGVRTQLREVLNGPRLTRYRLLLDDVNHADRLKRSVDKLALILGYQQQGISPVDDTEPKTIALDVPRPREQWDTIPGNLLRNWATGPAHPGFVLPVFPGVDVLGKPYCFDLAATPHILVAGTTGSGKSICLHALILSLLWRMSPDELGIALIDPKQVEFAVYQGNPYLHGNAIVNDTQGAKELLGKLLEEMNLRNSRFAEIGVTDIGGAAEKGERMQRIVVFVEELADLLIQDPEIDEPLTRLAHKARNTGIHLVLATQRPDAKTLSGLLRSNIPARIALSVQKSIESKIILDDTGAEKLLGHGDMLIVPEAGKKPTRIHGVYVNRDDIALCLKHFKAIR